MISKEEKERRMVFARKEAVKILETAMPPTLAVDPLISSVAEVLLPHMYAPHLGCASTLELINELIARLSEDRLELTEENLRTGDFAIPYNNMNSQVATLVTMSKELTEEELRYKTVPDEVR